MTYKITNNGRELALTLAPAIGVSGQVVAVASGICRNAKVLETINERQCSEEMAETTRIALEAKEARAEQRIKDLVASLPQPVGGEMDVSFQGDPRGHAVHIKMPPTWQRLHNHPNGIYVPTERS
jgi:hypothetical protein